MRKVLRSLVVALLFAQNFAASYTASSINFVPIPVGEVYRHRVTTALAFRSIPAIELETAYIYVLGSGVEVGAGLHAGVDGKDNPGGILGTDLVLRFLHKVSEDWFLGAQSQIGVGYTGIGEVSRAINVGFAFPITAGLVAGVTIQDVTKLYIFPAVELGQTMQAGNPLWKSGVGLRLAMGTVVSVKDDVTLFLEARPAIADFTGDKSAISTFNVGVSLGAIFDF